jgi:pimeloyl-ACP methyl ester carboxylesterase
MVEELYRLLRKADIDDDLILVGYRRGTWISRMFTNNYPELVNGLVLIEPIDENKHEDLPPGIRLDVNHPTQALKWMPAVTWLGITRLVGGTDAMSWFTDPFEGISVDARREILSRTIYNSSYWTNAYEELSLMDRIEIEFRNKDDLKDLPTVILINPNTPGPFDVSTQQNIERISSNSMVRTCDNCGGMPPITSPMEVVMAVQTLLTGIDR